MVFLSIVAVQSLSSWKASNSDQYIAAVGFSGSLMRSERGTVTDGTAIELESDGRTEAAIALENSREDEQDLRQSQLLDATPTFTMTGLPSTTMVQEGADITQAQWPAYFCVNVNIEAPDVSETDTPIKAIALMGGAGEAQSGTGKCGYFMICFITGNKLAMGVQCQGGGSDPPLGTDMSLTSFTTHDLSFCYDSTTSQATISIDGVVNATATRKFEFPRQGKVTVLAGSHDSDVELLEGVTLSSLTMSDMAVTTTTTTTTTTVTTIIAQNLQNYPFALQSTPRTVPAQRTATITEREWPPDFCANVVITTPATTTGVRAIALLGGIGHCGNFLLFFGDQNTIGMGVQCDAAGSNPSLVSTSSIPSGEHALTFCYAQIEGKASLSLDGNLLTSADKDWNYPRFGNVSVLVGSHLNNTEELDGVTLTSLSMVTHNPLSAVVVPTDAMGNSDAVTGTLAPTIASTNAGGNTGGSTNTNASANTTSASANSTMNTTNATNKTTTTTTTTTIIVEEITNVNDGTHKTSNSVSHHEIADNTVTHTDSDISSSKHVEANR